MLEESVRNFGALERIRTIDPEFGAEIYIEVTKDDLKGKGVLFPMGARHFAEQAKFIQELNTTMQAVAAMPTVAAHFSGKAVAKALEDALGWSSYKIVKDNAMVFEQADTQRLINQVQEDMQVEQQVPVDGPPNMENM
jgi:uncharacterized protein (DUF697 family)